MITDLLSSLLQSKNPARITENQLGCLAKSTSAHIAVAIQNIVDVGTSPAELMAMWEKNKRFLPDQSSKLRCELPQNHVLQKVLAEHDMVLCLMNDLYAVNKQVQKISSLSSTSHEVRRLAFIAEHLINSEQHREREEEIIYPALRQKGYSGLLEFVSRQHLDLSRADYKLKSLVWQVDEINTDFFKYQLAEYVNYLVPNMKEHIFVENNVIYPLAVELIKEHTAWVKMKEICDQIWY